MTTNIYIAAPLAEVRKARELKDRVLAIHGASVVSSWHLLVDPGAKDPLDTNDRTLILLANFADLDRADVVVAYLAGEAVPRTTFGEIGYALAKNKPVLMALPPTSSPNRCLLDAHPLVTEYTDDEEMETALKYLLVERLSRQWGTSPWTL